MQWMQLVTLFILVKVSLYSSFLLSFTKFKSTIINLINLMIGRRDSNFEDHNELLLDELCHKYPKLATLEMETFHL
jgi:hypothetical protein